MRGGMSQTVHSRDGKRNKGKTGGNEERRKMRGVERSSWEVSAVTRTCKTVNGAEGKPRLRSEGWMDAGSGGREG